MERLYTGVRLFCAAKKPTRSACATTVAPATAAQEAVLGWADEISASSPLLAVAHPPERRCGASADRSAEARCEHEAAEQAKLLDKRFREGVTPRTATAAAVYGQLTSSGGVGRESSRPRSDRPE